VKSRRALDTFIRRPPPLAVPERVAQMHDERVEVIRKAAGGRLIAAVLEL
jgi:hypothetical protein